MTATVLLLLNTNWDNQNLDPNPWLLTNRQQLSTTVEALLGRSEVLALLGVDREDIDKRAEKLKGAIAAATVKQEELDQDALNVASVPEEAHQLFRTLVTDAWEEKRSMLALFLSAGGRLMQDVGDVPTKRLALAPRLESKLWAVEYANPFGFGYIAQHCGQELAQGENRHLVARMRDSGSTEHEVESIPHDSDWDDLPSRLDELVRRMRDEGYHPSLLLHPRSRQLIRSLPVEPIVDTELLDGRTANIRGQRWADRCAHVPHRRPNHSCRGFPGMGRITGGDGGQWRRHRKARVAQDTFLELHSSEQYNAAA